MPKHFIFDKLSDKKHRLKIALQVSKLGSARLCIRYPCLADVCSPDQIFASPDGKTKPWDFKFTKPTSPPSTPTAYLPGEKATLSVQCLHRFHPTRQACHSGSETSTTVLKCDGDGVWSPFSDTDLRPENLCTGEPLYRYTGSLILCDLERHRYSGSLLEIDIHKVPCYDIRKQQTFVAELENCDPSHWNKLSACFRYHASFRMTKVVCL